MTHVLATTLDNIEQNVMFLELNIFQNNKKNLRMFLFSKAS